MRSFVRLLTALLTFRCAVVAQEPAIAQDKPVIHHYFSKSPHAPAAHWGYSGAIGPEHWGELHPSFRIASTGRQQSPIDISSRAAQTADLPPLKFQYREEPCHVINNGHSIQHNEMPGSFLFIGDRKFALEQFHAHAPSEHTVDGQHFPAELHFVHKSDTDEVVVVAVLLKADDSSTLQFPLVDDLPRQANENVSLPRMRSPGDFLPRNREYFRYSGSFTTPPCTEQVQWIVLQQPLSVRSDVLARLAEVLHANNRPVQPLNERIVQHSAVQLQQ